MTHKEFQFNLMLLGLHTEHELPNGPLYIIKEYYHFYYDEIKPHIKLSVPKYEYLKYSLEEGLQKIIEIMDNDQ